MHTIPFEHQNCLDPKLAGGKGHGLAGMAQAGIPVAPGFVASTAVYHEYLIVTGFQRQLEQAATSLESIGPAKVSRTAAEIQEFFVTTALPGHLSRAVADAYQALSAFVGIPEVPV